MSDFKVGDSVKLKIGGPKMSIFSIEGIGIVCQWFVIVKGNQELKSGMFQPEQLIKVEEQDEPQRVRRVIDSHREIE